MSEVKVDLSKVEHSMSNLIETNIEELNACSTVSEMYSKLKDLFLTNNLNTKASNRLLSNINKQRNLAGAQMTLYNSLLCGSKLGVL